VRFPVFIGLRRSYFLAASVCVMHGAAAGAFLVLPWPLPMRMVLLIVLAVSLWHTLRPARIRSLRLHQNGDLECVLSDGTSRPASPLPDTTVFSWLVVLRLEVEGEQRTVSLPLFPDHMSGDEFRILRLWLRWGVTPDIP
jgi:hypothetical protein